MRVSRIQTRRVSRIGARISSIPTTFARTGPAWLDGVEVSANTPRFPSQSGTRGVLVEEGGTNLLTANQASVETNTTGFNAFGSAVLTRDTTTAYTGAASLKVETPGSGTLEGFSVQYVTSAQGTYAGQVRLKGSGSVLVWVRIVYTDTTFTDASATVTLTSDWQNVATGAATSNGAKTVSRVDMYVRTNGAQAVTFWADALDLKAKAYATSWVPGGTTQNAETLTVPTNGLLTPSAGSVIIRYYCDGKTWPTNRTLMVCRDPADGSNELLIYRAANTNNLFARTTAAASVSTTIGGATAAAFTEGSHTLVLNYSVAKLSLWHAGVEIWSAATPNLPVSIYPTLYLGSNLPINGNQWNFPIPAMLTYGDAMTNAEASAASLDQYPPDFTAYLDATKGQLTVNQGHPYQTAELLNLFMDAR